MNGSAYDDSDPLVWLPPVLIAAVATAFFVWFAITGSVETQPTPLERGIECRDNGGTWTHDTWTGYVCEFPAYDE